MSVFTYSVSAAVASNGQWGCLKCWKQFGYDAAAYKKAKNHAAQCYRKRKKKGEASR